MTYVSGGLTLEQKLEFNYKKQSLLQKQINKQIFADVGQFNSKKYNKLLIQLCKLHNENYELAIQLEKLRLKEQWQRLIQKCTLKTPAQLVC